MEGREIVNYEELLDDTDSIYQCLSGRSIDVRINTSNEQEDIVNYVFRTKRTYKEDYVSITIRTSQDILNLKQHINNTYGCYLIPVFHQQHFTSPNDQLKLKQLNNYFKGLLQHRILRGDRELFTFLFLQNTSKPQKSRYQRFLNRLVDLSRQYLNKLLTRQAKQGRGEQQSVIHDYKVVFAEEEKNFRNFATLIDLLLNQQISRYNITITGELFPVGRKMQEKYRVDEANSMHEKSQRLIAIFEEVRQAFRLRVLLRENVKELKANSIRSKYNSRYEHLDRALEQSRRKYAFWTKQLLRELQCNIVLVRTLIKQLACMYYTLTQHIYSCQPPPPFPPSPSPIPPLP